MVAGSNPAGIANKFNILDVQAASKTLAETQSGNESGNEKPGAVAGLSIFPTLGKFQVRRRS